MILWIIKSRMQLSNEQTIAVYLKELEKKNNS